MDDLTVSTIFHEGVYMEPEFSEDLLEFASIDYSTYKLLEPAEFQLSSETQMLFMKVEKARNEFVEKSKKRQETGQKEFRIFGYSLQEIPVGANLVAILIILVISMGGLLYLLKSVMSDKRKAAGKRLAKNEDKPRKQKSN